MKPIGNEKKKNTRIVFFSQSELFSFLLYEPLNFTIVQPPKKLVMTFMTTSFSFLLLFRIFSSFLGPIPLEVEGILK